MPLYSQYHHNIQPPEWFRAHIWYGKPHQERFMRHFYARKCLELIRAQAIGIVLKLEQENGSNRGYANILRAR
jgi:hypothetical protein